jgi:hypothetical protein
MNQTIYVTYTWQWWQPLIQMMKSFLIHIGNLDQQMLGYIVLEFTYIIWNADKKIVQVF